MFPWKFTLKIHSSSSLYYFHHLLFLKVLFCSVSLLTFLRRRKCQGGIIRVLEQYTPEQQCQLPNRIRGLHLSRRQEVDTLTSCRSKGQVPLFPPNVFTISPVGILHLARLARARNRNKKTEKLVEVQNRRRFSRAGKH